jgi:hypothetical protein
LRHKTIFTKDTIMQEKSIQVGSTYHITLGRNEVLGEVVAETETGWEVRLTASDKVIKVNSAERFLRKARTIATTQDEASVATPDAEVVEPKSRTPKSAKTPQIENVATEKPKREGMSGLDAAHSVLVEIGTPLNARQITDLVIEKGYCPNLKGKTPHSTISSGMQREIARLGTESRFYKAGKGLFGATECQSE